MARSTEHQTPRFARALFKECSGLIEVRVVSTDKDGEATRIWLDEPNKVQLGVTIQEKLFGEWGKSTSVYFGLSTRKEKDKPSFENLKELPAIWCDIDTDKLGFDTDEVLRSLHKLPGAAQPSAVVRSGGGLHLYWFLDKPVLVSPDETDAITNHFRSLLTDLFLADKLPQELGNPRLPGSKNMKRATHRHVEVVWCYHWSRHPVATLRHAFENLDLVLGPPGTFMTRAERAKALEAVKPRVTDEFAWVKAKEDGTKTKNAFAERIWDHVSYHGIIGMYSIHEAITAYVAKRVMALKTEEKAKPEVLSKIVDDTIERVMKIKDAQAPRETWDWLHEREKIEKSVEGFVGKLDKIKKRRRKSDLDALAARAKANGVGEDAP